jgi:hypothetical protein
MNHTKIFKHNLKNNSNNVTFKIKKNNVGMNKYLPSFSKEWKNIIYSFNKQTLSNVPTFTENINKIVKSYFNLFFKDHRDIGIKKYIMLKRRRNFLRKIYISDTEIKHTNDKLIITLYTLNREKNILKKKYFKITTKINKKLLRQFFSLYNKNIKKIYKSLTLLNNKYNFVPSVLRKKTFLQSKFKNLEKFQIIKYIYLKKIWCQLLSYYLHSYLAKIRKYNFLYALNQFKFNKLSFLSVLSIILKKIISKKIEYNIVNLKYITNSTDIFTNIIALKLKRRKIRRLKEISRVLTRTNLPTVNTIQERTFVGREFDLYRNKYKDLKIISNLKNNNLESLLKNISSKDNTIFENIFHSIKYKNIGGIRIEVKGRLTKRYRADRSIYSLRWKGGLKNIDSSYLKKNTVLWRGNVNSNTTYSMTAAKRRIGAFAVKGWLGGK